MKPKLDKYKIVRRKEKWEEYDDKVDPDHLVPISEERFRDLYELVLSDRIIRATNPLYLHRRDPDAEWEE